MPTFLWCIWQGSHSSIKAGATFCDIICDGQGWNYFFQASVTFLQKKPKTLGHSGGVKKTEKHTFEFFLNIIKISNIWTLKLSVNKVAKKQNKFSFSLVATWFTTGSFVFPVPLKTCQRAI